MWEKNLRLERKCALNCQQIRNNKPASRPPYFFACAESSPQELGSNTDRRSALTGMRTSRSDRVIKEQNLARIVHFVIQASYSK